ncbi:hypothetical protein K491DRAFT_675874 [Lophiostoma macrostomum CBS 122681]|uniref:Uncharacterized protein n=1 Tax=Lophiostoma macrostomum CBS 122681 TaxID=1314788 RepID=A0A6A6TGN3_9PLEO|nr:hypothetical protein K491DRAFT_675874 [Lophiostoma macrostomum CBS 122681]
MPSCRVCGDYFSGRGTLCPNHDPYFFTSNKPSKARYVYDPDTDVTYTSSYPADIKYRTGQGYRYDTTGRGGGGGGHNRYHKDRYKSHKVRPYDAYNTYDGHDDVEYYEGGGGSGDVYDLSLVPSGVGMGVGMGRGAMPALAATAQAFRKLTRDCEIGAMNLHMHPTTSRPSTLSFVVNKDREQCPCCKVWFADPHKLKMHKWEFPSGCDIHKLCFGKEDEHYHGTQYRHERCFVKGCTSIKRREGGWMTGFVEEHVREWHWGG